MVMVYTTYKDGDDWGDGLWLFYPHDRITEIFW